MKVKCVSKRLNHIHFVTQADGSKKPVKIKVGDTFEVKGIPAMWEGLVVPLETEKPKVAATASGTKEQSTADAAKKPT